MIDWASFHDHTKASDNPISSISAIAYGFMGSQALFAALELGLFTALSDDPCGPDALAAKLYAAPEPLNILLATCLALQLLTWDGERYSNSPVAQRFLVQTAHRYVGDYYLRQISLMVYPQLPRVRSLLRGEALTSEFDYAHALADPQTTEAFVRSQHAGSRGPAAMLARSQDFSRYSRLLDLGGGSGAFAIASVNRYPALSAVVLDLPQVVVVTEQILQESGLAAQITCASGDLRTDPWPTCADVILMSYIVSCYDPQTVRALLARAQAYLPSGGRLVLHDFALHADRTGPHNTALFLFGQLANSAHTHAYIVDELARTMQEVGFVEVSVKPFLPDLTFLVSGGKR